MALLLAIARDRNVFSYRIMTGGIFDMIEIPELVVGAKNLAEMVLLEKADAFVIGDARFARVLRGSFDENELVSAVNFAHGAKKKVYLLIDAVFPNDLLVKLKVYLHAVKHILFDGVRVADLGAYLLVREIMPTVGVQFVDEMMLTNYETVNFWASRRIERVRLAHELTLDEVVAIKKNANAEIEVLVQGAPFMFTSRRKLVDNYLEFQRLAGKNVALLSEGNFLFDRDRSLYYPIIENQHGTHIYGGSDVCMIDDLAQLIAIGIDAIYLEGLTYESENYVKIVQLYKMAVELATVDKKKYAQAGRALYVEVEKLQGQFRQTDRGFYYKPTIYKNQSK